MLTCVSTFRTALVLVLLRIQWWILSSTNLVLTVENEIYMYMYMYYYIGIRRDPSLYHDFNIIHFSPFIFRFPCQRCSGRVLLYPSWRGGRRAQVSSWDLHGNGDQSGRLWQHRPLMRPGQGSYRGLGGGPEFPTWTPQPKLTPSRIIDSSY